MVKINRVKCAVTLCFAVIIVIYCCSNAGFIKIGSRFIWTFNRGYYNDLGIYFYTNDYIVSPAGKTSTDYEFDQLCALKEECDKAGVDLLFVNKPTKYLDDSIFDKMGVKCYCNQNADKLISRLRDVGIDCLDLRESLTDEGLNIYDMFYRTDHHWTVPAGKWAACKIAEHLNQTCGYSIDTSIYNDSNYTFKTTHNAWLGEQGMKLTGSPIQYDDYTLVTPNFTTSYDFDGYKNDFSYFINDPNNCAHYNYCAIDCVNELVDKGNILFLGDSYDLVTEPFLSLGVHKIHFDIRRNMSNSINISNNISSGNFDTVIVCYAAFMIGAHDDPKSANYDMFTLAK